MGEAAPALSGGVSVVLGGEAGQGIQTIEFILAKVLKRSGYHVFSTKEYMSRVRGGSNSILIRVSSRRVRAVVDHIDILMPLDSKALERLSGRIGPRTLVVGDRANLPDSPGLLEAPTSTIAEEVGGRIHENAAAVGVLSGILNAEEEVLMTSVREFFADKDEAVIERNLEAVRRGYEVGNDLCRRKLVCVDIEKNISVRNEPLINGAEAVAFGAIAGGCNFVSSYPMSPSTAVLTNLASRDEDFGIVVEQAEDEIAAVNMAVGAWYAGARALVTTSGGGFALMGEGVSLAGMIETPLVIHLAQRPGPATGLPTRTEQGDLELALYSGHGEFPRIIYAPGTIEEAFALVRRAFNEADRCQVPVFILTDQYFMDTYYNTAGLDIRGEEVRKHLVRTDADYLRYRFTGDGISPRGVPGFGDGLVTADSDEHDEAGHITEDMGVRTAMVDKRLRKMDAVLAGSLPPGFTGGKNYRNLIVTWGSTYPIVKEAFERKAPPSSAHLHLSQVYPLPPSALQYLKKADRVIVVENNATCQLGRLIKLHAGVTIDGSLLKYSGLPFSVEEVEETIQRAERK